MSHLCQVRNKVYEALELGNPSPLLLYLYEDLSPTKGDWALHIVIVPKSKIKVYSKELRIEYECITVSIWTMILHEVIYHLSSTAGEPEKICLMQ